MPRNRGARVRVAPNIYRDKIGYSVAVTVGTGELRRSKEKRYPPHTDFAIMKEWRESTRKALRHALPRRHQGHDTGTLGAAVKRYLPNIKALASKESRLCDLEAWKKEFWYTPRTKMTTALIDAELHRWRAAGVAASTCNHRRNALIQLWRTLDGPDAPNPAEHATHFREEQGAPRDLDPSDLDEIVNSMPPSKTRAFYRVFCETAWSPARIRLLKPQHLKLDEAQAYLLPRRKGQGTDGRVYPLTPRAVAALREFVELKAWGGVTKEALYTSFQRAVKRVNAARLAANRPLLPPAIRPYDARHTFGTEAWKVSSDPQAVAELMDVSMDTVMRYIRGAVPDRLKAVTAALAKSRGASLAGPDTGPDAPSGHTRSGS